jgi:hypothetical protein
VRTLRVRPSAGTDFHTFAANGKAAAALTGHQYCYYFNGVSCVVNAYTDPHKLYARYRKCLDLKSRAYKASPLAKERERQDQLALKESQENMDLLWALMDAREHRVDDRYLMQWLMEYADIADDIRIKNKRSGTLVVFLMSLGFVSGAHVGRDPRGFNNRRMMIEYIAGQILASAEHGLPPHPSTTIHFGEDYFKLTW